MRFLQSCSCPLQADLQSLGAKLNPVVKYYDPLNVETSSPWGFTEEQTIGWYRHSEIKHGRVAMAAFGTSVQTIVVLLQMVVCPLLTPHHATSRLFGWFVLVGYCVQSNFHFPWAMTLDGTPFPSTDLSPPDQWDALPFESKAQIILFIGFLEFYSELTPRATTKSSLPHYTKGGQPGKYPTFDDIPHPVPFNLYDPFGFSKNMKPEVKERRLLSEINNGRLAMLGIL